MLFIMLSITLTQLTLLALFTNSVCCTDNHQAHTVNSIAFGSCHKIKSVKKFDRTLIWDGIRTLNPDTFLWLGDTIYPLSKGTASTSDLEKSYHNMKFNDTLGYRNFRPPHGIYGTWDDHDYGGNDRGNELKNKQERQSLFLQFLDIPLESNLYQRKGVYNSVTFGEESTHKQVKVIFLDTRYHRQRHCIPSVAAISYIHPFGAIIACFTRWLYSGLHVIPYCHDRDMLGSEQWKWLQHELQTSTAQIHVIVSSIQIFTSNPFVESWAHFPSEKARLLQVVNNTKGVLFLSGDVHYAEISALLHPNKIIEVTSSGLTHSCETASYGPLCPFIINAFSSHRRTPFDYSLKRNFGSIAIQWEEKTLSVNIHDNSGHVDLSTGEIPIIGKRFIVRQDEIDGLLEDNAVNRRFVIPIFILFGILCVLFYFVNISYTKTKLKRS